MTFLGVYGHVVLDHILRVPRLPEPNTSIQIERRERYFGGTGGNIARVAARLGVTTALAAFVGEDFPPAYRKALTEDGIDLTDLREVAGYATPTAWIFTDPRANQVAVIDQGPMQAAADLELLEHTVAVSDHVHLATGRPEAYARIVEVAKAKGVPVTFDPSQEIHYVYEPTTFRTLLEASDFFFGNRSEVARGLEYLGLEDIEQLLQFTDVVVLTRGTEGSTILTAEAAWDVPGIPAAAVVDVTGAGDAYRGGFYAGLSRDLDLPHCGLLGAATASFVVEGRGPQDRIPTWNEVRTRAETAEDQLVERTP